MYSLRSGTTRSKTSTRGIKIQKKGVNSTAKSYQKKEKKIKESGDMKKRQSIHQSYKRKWDEDMKRSERKATKSDMKKSQNIDKESKEKEDGDIKKSKCFDKGNRTAEGYMKKKPSIDEENSSRESNEDYITQMPNEILLKIFSTLSMKDLMKIQFVSPKLQDAAQDSSLWKDFKVNFNCIHPSKLKYMPGIRNIEGHTTNSAIKTILDNVIDLRKLDCLFYPDMSRSQMKQIVNKYKNLESVAVNMCSPNGLECLQVLKSIKSLQKIKLCFCDDHDYDSHSRFCSFKLPKLSHTFFGDDNFPLLENVEVKFNLEDKRISDDLGDVSCLAEIIKSKSQQLKCLNIAAEIDANILEAVKQCTKLENLNIRLYANRLFREYGIDTLTELKKLDFSVVAGDSNTILKEGDPYSFILLSRLSESIKQGSWSYLTSVKFIFKRRFERSIFDFLNAHIVQNNGSPADLLKSIVDNMKALKNLHFEYYGSIISDEQLLNIGDLESLESFKLYGVYVSNTGMSYLSNCHNLRILELDTFSCNVRDSDVAAMVYSMEKLEFLSLKRLSQILHIQSQNRIRKWISSVLPRVM